MTFTEEEIDNGIFEVLRRAAVAGGYLPDVQLFPETPSGRTAYGVAKKVILDAYEAGSKKPLIEVFASSNIQARDEEHNNKITIRRDDFVSGSLGFYGTKKHVSKPDGSFDVYMNASGTVIMQYQISFVTDDWDFLLHSLIINALKLKGYCKAANNDGTLIDRRFKIKYVTTLDKSGSDFVEKALLYNIGDVVIEQPVLLENVKGITEIIFETDPGDGNVSSFE